MFPSLFFLHFLNYPTRFFEILSVSKDGNAEIADKVSVQLIKNDSDKPINERIAKDSEKKTLFDALDVGFVWLDRALKE